MTKARPEINFGITWSFDRFLIVIGHNVVKRLLLNFIRN